MQPEAMEGAVQAEEQPCEGAFVEEQSSRLRSPQFRLRAIFGAMAAVGLFLAVPRLIGMDYGLYFGWVYEILYCCVPLVTWICYALLPRSLRQIRVMVAGGVAVALVVPLWAVLVWDWGGPGLFAVAATIVIFWMPQIVFARMLWSILQCFLLERLP